MNEWESDIIRLGELEKQLGAMERFGHEGMATFFEILVSPDQNMSYAEQAARECFQMVDFLEGEFSRFIENSDISRLNSITESDKIVTIGLETFECLKIARDMYERTNRVFDVTVGFLVDCWLAEDKSLREPSENELRYAMEHVGVDLIELDEEYVSVRLHKVPLCIDLGGVGKGYAVDKMGEILREWEVGGALIHGGCSSRVLEAPGGMEGWPVSFSDPAESGKCLGTMSLCNTAMSGSALEQGLHIIDPRVGRPVEGAVASWATAPSCLETDVLSTAFMIMRPEEIADYCAKNAGSGGMVVKKGDGGELEYLKFGEGNLSE